MLKNFYRCSGLWLCLIWIQTTAVTGDVTVHSQSDVTISKPKGPSQKENVKVAGLNLSQFPQVPFQFPDVTSEDASRQGLRHGETRQKAERLKGSVPRVKPHNKANFRCPHGLYQCQSNECVAQTARCNGRRDCSDNSDEQGCPKPKKTKRPPKYQPPEPSPTVDPEWAEKRKSLPCGAGLWSCVDRSLCILPLQRCDGTNNCEDGSDEWECGEHREYAAYLHSPIKPARPGHGTSEWRCPSQFYTCKNRQCILWNYRCDGRKHCHDGSDEWNCGKETLKQLMDERDRRKMNQSNEEQDRYRKQQKFADMMEKQRQKMEKDGFKVPETGDKEEL